MFAAQRASVLRLRTLLHLRLQCHPLSLVRRPDLCSTILMPFFPLWCLTTRYVSSRCRIDNILNGWSRDPSPNRESHFVESRLICRILSHRRFERQVRTSGSDEAHLDADLIVMIHNPSEDIDKE